MPTSFRRFCPPSTWASALETEIDLRKARNQPLEAGVAHWLHPSRAHSSQNSPATGSIPLPTDAALMSGGFEWCGARYGIRRCLSGLALSRNDFGFEDFPCSRLIAGAVLTALSDIDAFGTQARAHRSSIVFLTHPIPASMCIACRRRSPRTCIRSARRSRRCPRVRPCALH